MTYQEFATVKPVLYGQIVHKNRAKIGAFKAQWDHLTNSLVYWYITPNGRRGSGGYTLKRAYELLKSGGLSTDPEKGKPENYV